MTYTLTQEEVNKVRDLIAMLYNATEYGMRKLSLNDKQEEIVIDLIRDIQRFLS